MIQIIFIMVLVVVIGLLVFWKLPGKSGPMYEFLAAQAEKKKVSKEKILSLLAEKGEVSNMELKNVLKLSRRTIIRYMDELEREGKVEQVGKIGRMVAYRLKN